MFIPDIRGMTYFRQLISLFTDSLSLIADEIYNANCSFSASNKESKDFGESRDYRDTNYWNGLYAILILFLGLLRSIPITLVPQHDGIKHPEYWFELMITMNLTYGIMPALTAIVDAKYLLRMESMLSIRIFASLYLAYSLSFDILYCIVYYIWTAELGLQYPIPFTNVLLYVSSIVYLFVLWFQFPSLWRSDAKLRKHINAYFLANIWVIFIMFEYSCMRTSFKRVPMDRQWIIALILPIIREVNSWVLNKVVKRVALCTDLEAKANVNIVINCAHSLYIAITIATIATPATTYLILGIDFILNLYSCWKIYKINKKVGLNDTECETIIGTKREEITMLILTELVEILVPISYSVTFLMAFYGPNAEILGNVGNCYWYFKKVENVNQVLIGVYQMFFLDTLSAVIGGVFLWRFSSINILHEYCHVVKNFWPLIAIRLGNGISKVRLIIYDMFIHITS